MKASAKKIVQAVALAATMSIAACGGGDSEPAVSANGIWDGTLTATYDGVGSFTFDISAMIHEGRILAASKTAGANYLGVYTLEGGTLSGTVTPYRFNEGPFATTQISGAVKGQESLKVEFAASYGATGSMSLSFRNSYNRPSALALTAGEWSFSEGGYSLSITAGADGAFSGQDSAGCKLRGTLALLDPARNLYKVQTTIEECGTRNGSYSGFATLADEVAANDRLQMVVFNESLILPYHFSRSGNVQR